MSWRAFVGQIGDSRPDRSYIDRGGLTWEQAREALIEHLRPYETDECVDCREAGTEALAVLAALPEGSEWAWEVDGEDYLLERELIMA